ncbi:hypothetical protein ACN47E_003828 [Coniothyrium glycines]
MSSKQPRATTGGGRQQPRHTVTKARIPRPSTSEPKGDPLFSSSCRSKPDFCLSIDLGTKRTTLAVARPGSPWSEISTIREFEDDPYPGIDGSETPTELLYLRPTADHLTDVDQNAKLIAGYSIKALRDGPDYDNSRELGHVVDGKLLLDCNKHIGPLKKNVIDILKKLVKAEAIKTHHSIILDLLMYFLGHAQSILTRDYGLTNHDRVEVTFTIPVSWNPRAYAEMSAFVHEAMTRLNFGLDALGRPWTFMVNEAEAAAMYALASTCFNLMGSSVFMIMDCGGGTTDIGVYQVQHEEPFRLGCEVIPVRGAVVGAGDVDQAARKFFIRRLRNAQYPDMDTVSIEEYVDREVLPRFEQRVKRSFSLKATMKQYAIPLSGLQAIQGDSSVRQGAFLLSHKDMHSLFSPALTKISNLMTQQLLKALDTIADVHQVILVGGFGDSPALKELLREELTKINSEQGTEIKLLANNPNAGAAGLAKGALLRAQDKNNAPDRVTRLSIGVYHHVNNDEEFYGEEVVKQADPGAWQLDEVDGYHYLHNTIKWLMKKGSKVDTIEWTELVIFTPAHQTWIVERKLFASDECTEDYFQRSHPKNHGKTFEFGQVRFDITAMKRHSTLIMGEEDGQRRYEVNLRLKMKVTDNYLGFTAFLIDEEGQILEEVQGYHKPISVVGVLPSGAA